jgi:hypothetical protein
LLASQFFAAFFVRGAAFGPFRAAKAVRYRTRVDFIKPESMTKESKQSVKKL